MRTPCGRACRAEVPIQPYLISQAQYCQQTVEWIPRTEGTGALCYQFCTGSAPLPLRLIPDACINVLFACGSHPAAILYGVQTAPQELPLAPDTVYFGFKPYSAHGMRPLGPPWSALVDGQMDFTCALPDGVQIMAALASAGSFEARLALMPDFICRLPAAEPAAPERAVQADYTASYRRAKFKQTHGIAPKRYASIVRFQTAVRLLTAAQSETQCLADAVFAGGYFDQSHLNREFRRFAGDTPLHYRQAVLRGAAGRP